MGAKEREQSYEKGKEENQTHGERPVKTQNDTFFASFAVKIQDLILETGLVTL